MMNDIMSLSGKNILVTGASSGIGRGICIVCHRLGARVIALGRNIDALHSLADEDGIDRNLCYSFDLKQVSQIEELVSLIVEKHGRLDGLVHSAGICVLQSLNLSTYEHAHDTFMINFYAFLELVRCFTKKGNNNASVSGASIIGISSKDSIRPQSGASAYAASKGAMNSSVLSIAAELARKKIRVNAILPGVIRTAIYESYERKTGKEELLQIISQKQPLGLGEPSDIANMSAFLLSDAGKLITGQLIVIDGGGIVS